MASSHAFANSRSRWRSSAKVDRQPVGLGLCGDAARAARFAMPWRASSAINAALRSDERGIPLAIGPD